MIRYPYFRTSTFLFTLVFTFGIGVSGHTQREADASAMLNFQGQVLDAKTGDPVEAHLEFWKMPDGDNVGIYELQEAGKFDMVVDNGSAYVIEVVAVGYFPLQDNLNVYDEQAGTIIRRAFELRPLAVGEMLRLDNLLFALDASDITPESYPELDRLARLLTLNPSLEVQLEGHTDVRGDPRSNYKLSKERVEAVGKFLEGRGIDKKRLAYKAFGGSRPLEREGSLEQRSVNRRVEARVTKI